MSKPEVQAGTQLVFPFDEYQEARTLLDKLLIQSRLYQSSNEFKELLDFAIRLRSMAPFNAMLLQIQKPGLTFAASAYDWETRFKRTIKFRARPLLILWPFGPVGLVYDVLDTEGPDLPKDVSSFYAKGKINDDRIAVFESILQKRSIAINFHDRGDDSGGYLRRLSVAPDKKSYSKYELGLNRNHSAATKFSVLVHELAHLFLGHLGEDLKLKIEGRKLEYQAEEVEAESVAYLVCRRNKVERRSESYLTDFFDGKDSKVNLPELYPVLRSAGRIEQLLNLSENIKMGDDVIRLRKSSRPSAS